MGYVVTRKTGSGARIHYAETAGPSSYSTGGFTYDTKMSNVSFAVAIAGGGYTAEVVSISGGTLTIKVYSGAGSEVAGGTDLSGVKFYILAIGD